MTGTLDWKWIGIGVVVMVVLNFIAGLTLGLFLAPQLEGVASPQDVALSGGQIVLAAVLNFLAFAIGGFIVGLKSAGRTILEPGISAAVAVLIALLISGNFTVVNRAGLVNRCQHAGPADFAAACERGDEWPVDDFGEPRQLSALWLGGENAIKNSGNAIRSALLTLSLLDQGARGCEIFVFVGG